ncbi:MAG: GNAT family N-acetyltransferase [Caldilineaceae bacterium]|nr:GNAT family N-acetyltransferase [Caldilineaceae bacterium]
MSEKMREVKPPTPPGESQFADLRQTTPTHMALDDGLLLRSVQSQEDAERYAAFNADYVSAIQGLTCAKLLAHHPTMRWDDFFFVEDQKSGAVVSTICLIPWRCRLGGVELQVAMLEMVVTHPAYRHRGLVRKQIEHFHNVVAAQGFDLCIIEGIDYYYRQYGYAYAADHWASDGLAAARVPESAEALPIRLRAATVADVPQLDDFYRQTMSQLDGWTMRAPAYWRYLLEAAAYPVAMVEDVASGAALGYVVGEFREEKGVHIFESSLPSAAAALALLQWCKTRGGGELTLGWPAESILVQVGRSLGSSKRFGDQWLWRVVDWPRFLQKLAPLLAARLADSAYAGLTAELTINLYCQGYLLRFVAGELTAVEPLGFVDASMGADGGDLLIPPDAFVRLLLGFRSLDELTDAWPDTGARRTLRHLWQVLWPRQDVYFWKPYMAYRDQARMLRDESSEPT